MTNILKIAHNCNCKCLVLELDGSRLTLVRLEPQWQLSCKTGDDLGLLHKEGQGIGFSLMRRGKALASH